MKDLIGIEEINTEIILINRIFLTGKTKIGARINQNGIIIFTTYEGKDELTIEKDLTPASAYSYLMGFKVGFNAPHWD